MYDLRYVVLHHTGIAEPHFDLLFEWEPGEPLTSFRCPAWPPCVGDRFEERPDHRAVYLTREGPLTGDRGSVARVEAGTIVHQVIASDPPTLTLRLDGRSLSVVNVIEDSPTPLTTWIVVAMS